MAKIITKQARVLQASAAHGAAPNDLIEASAETIEALAKAGIVDAAADAVNWCKEIGARCVSLVDAAGASELAAAAAADAQAAADAKAAADAQAAADAKALAPAAEPTAAAASESA